SRKDSSNGTTASNSAWTCTVTVVPRGMSTAQTPLVLSFGSGKPPASQSAIGVPVGSIHWIVTSETSTDVVTAFAWTAWRIPAQSRNRGTPDVTSDSSVVVA